MSILLEALKQKNQRVKDTHVSNATPDLPSLALVEAEQSQHTESIGSRDQVEESMQSLVSKLSIEPPDGLDWQLKSDVSVQPISLVDDKTQMGIESLPSAKKDVVHLAFDLISPTNTKSSDQNDEVNQDRKLDVALELEVKEITSLAVEPIPSVEEVMPSESLILVDPQRAPLSEEPTSIIITEQPVEISISSAEPVSDAQMIDDRTLVEAELGLNQSISSRMSLPTIDKSPLSAKRFLSFSRRAVPASESKQSLVKESVQPKKHQPSSYKVRQPILIVGGALIGFGVVGYATLVAWEAQQEAHMQQMAHYKNLALTELPQNIEPVEKVNSEIRDSGSSSIAISNSDEGKELAHSQTIQSSMSISQDSVIKEKSAKVLVEAENKKVSQLSHTQGILDTNRSSNDQRGLRSFKVNTDDFPQMNLLQTQPTVELLVAAYQAWQLGQVAQAEQLYRQVLEKQPQQRDALLGMLAVSQSNGSDQSIVLGYALQLRRLYPKDQEVRFATGRILEDAPNDQVSETELKLAQRSSENVAEASYRLGLFYVEQQRWAEAQSAFFEAVRKNPYQVDYRLNLAISYDQLGKHRLALEHYQVALSQANSGLTKMDQSMIHERVSYLQTRRLFEE